MIELPFINYARKLNYEFLSKADEQEKFNYLVSQYLSIVNNDINNVKELVNPNANLTVGDKAYLKELMVELMQIGEEDRAEDIREILIQEYGEN